MQYSYLFCFHGSIILLLHSSLSKTVELKIEICLLGTSTYEFSASNKVLPNKCVKDVPRHIMHRVGNLFLK